MQQLPRLWVMNNLDTVYQELGSNICLAPFLAGWYSTASEINVLRPCSVTCGNWNIEGHNISEGLNSDKWVNLRKAFVHNSCHDIKSCITCSRSEKNNSVSFRQQINKAYVEMLPINIVDTVKEIVNNDYIVEQIYVLEYFPSNYCTYECIMCNGGASSARGTFELKNFNIKNKLFSNPHESDFYQVLNNLVVLNLTGGETILQPELHKLIDYLIEHDIAKNVIVTMLTNCSSFPDQLVDKFKQFKDCYYTLSIDGVEDVIEYQRRGAVWSEVSANAVKINKTFGSVVNYVLTAVNVFSFDKFVAWVQAVHLDIVFISLENSTGYLSVEVIPDELKLPLIEKLKLERSNYSEQWCIDLLTNVIDILTTITHKPYLIDRFVKHILIEDAASKKTLVEVVPEWKPYFE
jgi:MoaA/NifB/PqqE/SkfB family radical SAM enzyme